MTYPTISPELTLDFAKSEQLDPRITFTRTSTGTYVDSNGLIKTAPDGVARFEYDSSGKCLGLLVEESRTNLLTYSEDFTSWPSNIAITLTSSAIQSPDGNLTATRFQEDTSNNRHQIRQTVSSSYSSGNKYSLTIFAKSGGSDQVFLYFASADFSFGQVTFDLTNLTYNVIGAGTSARITSYPDGWKKLEVTATATATGTSIPIHIGRNDTFQVGDPNEDFYIWGAQAEAGSFPTSYIPTAGVTVTRAADAASITGTNFSNWYNQSEGTWLVNYEATFGKEDTTVFRFNTFENNGIFSYKNLNRVQFQYGGPYIYSTTVTTTNDYAKAAMFYESDGTFGGSFEGTAVVSAAGTSNIATELKLAPFTGASGARQSSTSHVSRLTYYPERVSDASLQELTS